MVQSFSIVAGSVGAALSTPDELNGGQAQLFRHVDLGWDEDDLSTETPATLALHPDDVEELVAQRRGDLTMLIAHLHPDAAELWQRLRDNPELQAMRASLHGLIPTDEEIAAAGERPGDAWQPLSKTLVAARDRARGVIRNAS